MSAQMLTGILVSLMVLAGLGIAYYSISRKEKYKGKQFGDVIMSLAFEYEVSWNMLCIFAIILGETFIAGTLIDDKTNPVGRMIPHLAIGSLSFLGAVTFVKQITNFFKSISDKESAGLIIVKFLMMWTSILIMLGCPLANTLILANGYKQTDTVILLYHQFFHSQNHYIAKVVAYGYSWPYSAIKEISNGLLASIVLNIVGLVMSIIEVFRAGVEKMQENNKKSKVASPSTPTKPANPNPAPANPPSDPAHREAISHIEKLLSFYGLAEDLKKNILTRILTILPSTSSGGQLDPADQAKIGSEIAKLVVQMDTVNRENPVDPTKVADLKKLISTQFAKKTTEGGLGINLPLSQTSA